MKKTIASVFAGLVLCWTAGVRADDAPATMPAAKPKIEITVDTSAAPECADFAARAKAAGEQYWPTICEMLPSKGYTPATKVTLTFKPVADGQKHYVAYTSSAGIFCDPDYYTKHPNDVGSIIHELVHVDQHYTLRNPPGWLTEGIADWVRWFHYEPASKRPHPTGDKAKYNAAYQTTAAFLDWASKKYDKDLVMKLNAASREHHYDPKIWIDLTGKSAADLGAEWKASTTE
jgi:hypothetical protein